MKATKVIDNLILDFIVILVVIGIIGFVGKSILSAIGL